MDQTQQIADIKAKSNTFTATQLRQVQGGYVVNGSIQYMDKETKGVMLSENAEGVASTPEQAAQMSLNYLRTGNFEGSAPATAPLFDNAGGTLVGNTI